MMGARHTQWTEMYSGKVEIPIIMLCGSDSAMAGEGDVFQRNDFGHRDGRSTY